MTVAKPPSAEAYLHFVVKFMDDEQVIHELDLDDFQVTRLHLPDGNHRLVIALSREQNSEIPTFPLDDNNALGAFAERRAAEARREGHNERCYYCGEPCNDLAGDPGEWSIGLSHPDEPGLVKYHHTRCIFVRLHPDPLTAAEDKARRAAIEECAQEADDYYCPVGDCGKDIAERIRALADKPAAGKGEP